jgi:alpha-ketoglutaric semialdehyde dehydrogenase
MTELLKNYVGGVFRDGPAGPGTQHVNPADARDIIAHVPDGTADDVKAAVDAASAAWPSWRRLPGPARAEHLYKWAGAMETRREELAKELSREVGKPIAEARGEIGRCIVILRYYAGEAVRSNGEVVPAQAVDTLQFTLREPLGVVALITPWNFPAAIPLWKTAPALAFGNTVVLKPAEQASRMAFLLAETAAAAELPGGVFNVVLGPGRVVGNALLKSEAVRAVSFTGSSTIGAQVAAECSRRNIRYQTEMGGKNVVIVLADADLDMAARLTAGGAFRYAGQKCTATSRAVVAKEVEEAFIRKLVEQTEALPLGPVGDAAAAIGPVINGGQRDYLNQAIEAVATSRVTKSGAASAGDYAHGYFVDPTVIRNADPDSPIAKDELFGPVLATFTATDLDEAIALANRTEFGLSASIFTRDIRSAMKYIHGIEAGLVRVNGDTTGVDPHAPFGGVKGSSSGSREQGSAAREFYTEIKTVQIGA